ncbi:MAG: OmpH family outer membrane protein [Candidatus Gastranaerophilales bacterium]|nr:OmpH family outer membrane protein [Candidatus Gastranaerophilales bacterium]
MKYLKTIISLVAITMSIFISNTGVFAEEIGTVDINKIINNYSKAQEVVADLKIKESELQKFVAEARKDLKLNTTTDKKDLEDKYTKEFKQKTNAFKQEEIKQLSVIQRDIAKAIKNVADTKNIKSVFKKESMIMGSQDLTDEVLKILNAKTE